MIKINFEQVHHLGDTLKHLEMADDFNEFMTPKIKASREEQLLSFFWPSVICHSTKGGLKGRYDGKMYNGWDYLLRSFCAAAEHSPESISVAAMQNMDSKKLLGILSAFATEDKITLTDLERRAEMLAKCAGELTMLFNGSVSELLNRTDNKVGGNNGAYALLETLSVFKDELKKKSTAFLMTVHFSGLWTVKDPENVFPMIDYHRMRVFCRTGCIEIGDENLVSDLIDKNLVAAEVESELRSLSFDICKYLIDYTGIELFDFDALIWAHARSCCRNKPVCVSKELEDDSFYDYLKKDFGGNCEYCGWCKGFKDERYRSIWEPAVVTENY